MREGNKGEEGGGEPHPAAAEPSAEPPERQASLLGLGTAGSLRSRISAFRSLLQLHCRARFRRRQTQLVTQEPQQSVRFTEAKEDPGWRYLLMMCARCSCCETHLLWFYIINLLLLKRQTAVIATFSSGRS